MAYMNTAVNSQYFYNSRLKNLKRKILKCNSSIYFNKQTLNSGRFPKHDRIQVPNSCSAANFTNTKGKTCVVFEAVSVIYLGI